MLYDGGSSNSQRNLHQITVNGFEIQAFQAQKAVQPGVTAFIEQYLAMTAHRGGLGWESQRSRKQTDLPRLGRGRESGVWKQSGVCICMSMVGKHTTELTTCENGSICEHRQGNCQKYPKATHVSIDSDSAVPGGDVKISKQVYCWSRNIIQRMEKGGYAGDTTCSRQAFTNQRSQRRRVPLVFHPSPTRPLTTNFQLVPLLAAGRRILLRPTLTPRLSQPAFLAKRREIFMPYLYVGDIQSDTQPRVLVSHAPTHLCLARLFAYFLIADSLGKRVEAEGKHRKNLRPLLYCFRAFGLLCLPLSHCMPCGFLH
eukprot:6189935-Pleurochrysis_carterae.AAC.5